MIHKFLLIFIFVILYNSSFSSWLEIRLPDDIPTKGRQLCSYEPLPHGTWYAVRFVPRLRKATIQSIFLYSCLKPGQFKTYWDCSQESPPCEDKDEKNLIFTWTKDVKSIELPDNVGFKLEGDTKSKYFAMQVSYSYPSQVEQLLNSVQSRLYSDSDGDGVDVYLSSTWQKYLAGVYSFSSKDFAVSSDLLRYHIDLGCKYGRKRIAPFAYRCVTNSKAGQSVLAYRIRYGSWALIGRANPRDPQGFYPIADVDMMVIKPGDYLALRCVYDVQQTDFINKKNRTESCNFYFMYYMLNKNIPPHQYEERCNTLIQNVMNFPSKGNTGKSLDTKLHTTMPVISIPVTNPGMIINKTIFTSQNLHVETNKLPNITTSIKPIEVTQIDFKSVSSLRPKPKIFIDPLYSGPKPNLIPDWMVMDEKKSIIGYISSVGLSKKGEVVVLHRSSRNISVDSFDDEHYYTDNTNPIKENTIVHVDSFTGKVLQSFGNDIFYLPHSLTIDHENSYWITDIALHQVFKFTYSKMNTPSLILGIATIPGNDDKHFCEPTDVAIDRYSNIFVADGYCNSRIMKFDKKGKLLKKWGSIQNGIGELKTGQFVTPHSLSIDSKLEHLYVSDLHTGNILKFDMDGNFLQLIRHIDVNGKLFSIDFNQAYDGIIYTLSGLFENSGAVGHIISAKTGELLTKWNIIAQNLEKPHDIITSKDNTEMYILINSELWKFNIHNPQGQLENVKNAMVDENGNYYSEIKIIKPIEDDKSVLPAVIVVTILAIPVVLAVVTMLVQYFVRKYRHNKVSMVRMQKHRFWNSSSNEVLCYGCCITRKHYYDGNRGMGNFMTGSDDESDCDEEDLFTGKA